MDGTVGQSRSRPLFIFGPRQYQTLIPHFPKCVCVCLCIINHNLLKTFNILAAEELKPIRFNNPLSLFFFGPRQYQTFIPHFPKCVCNTLCMCHRKCCDIFLPSNYVEFDFIHLRFQAISNINPKFLHW